MRKKKKDKYIKQNKAKCHSLQQPAVYTPQIVEKNQNNPKMKILTLNNHKK
jgi:hypothetical protein